MTDVPPSAAIILERGASLLDCSAAGLRLIALDRLATSEHDELDLQPSPDEMRDQVRILLSDGGAARVDLDDMGGMQRLRIRSGLRSRGLGDVDVSMEGPDAPTRDRNGRIDGRAALGTAATIGRMLHEMAMRVAEDPMGHPPRATEDASGIRGFGYGPAQDGIPPSPVAAALVAGEIARLGYDHSILSSIAVVVAVPPNGVPYASLRFSTDADLRDVAALTEAARLFLRPIARPSMLVSIDGERVHVRPVRTMPAPVDRSDDPMTALRAEEILSRLGTPPSTILSAKAIRCLDILSGRAPHP